MSASSRSTIFSIRSKKSKDSAEFPHTHAGPAYDDLPMAPRPPISVPTIIPPSQLQQLQQQQNGGGRGYYMSDEGDESDSYSVKSEPRNGYGGMRGGGSISAASLGGVSGPRPLPPRSGSAEKIQDVRYIPLGIHESPNVPYPPPRGEGLTGGRNYIRNERARIMDQRDHDCPICLPSPTPSVEQCPLLPSTATTEGQQSLPYT